MTAAICAPVVFLLLPPYLVEVRRPRLSDPALIVALEAQYRLAIGTVLSVFTVAATAAIAFQQYALARRHQSLQRFQDVLQSLNSSNVVVRVGALQALNALAADDERYRDPALRLLLAQLRSDHFERDTSKWLDIDRPDLFLALGLLSQILHECKSPPSVRVTLAGAGLGKGLYEDLRYTLANFEAVNLAGAIMRRSAFVQCLFPEAQFPDSDLERVVFTGSDLTGANFDGAVLTDVDLSNCSLDAVSARDAIFRRCDLEACSFLGADLEGAQFTDCQGAVPLP
jgi:uncharacterized protein YjbI with pentapeptide repeats